VMRWCVVKKLCLMRQRIAWEVDDVGGHGYKIPDLNFDVHKL
jgi:hypothetical protein